jgi:hypothetical protein
MSAVEMRMNLCCPEECFQAETAGECLIELQMWMSLPLAKLSLSMAVTKVCQKVFSEAECMEFATMGPLNLFMMTFGKFPTARGSEDFVLTCCSVLFDPIQPVSKLARLPATIDPSVKRHYKLGSNLESYVVHHTVDDSAIHGRLQPLEKGWISQPWPTLQSFVSQYHIQPCCLSLGRRSR